MLVVGKEANTLSILHGITNCVKNGTRKIVSSNRASRSLQCHPHLLSVKFENLVHRFFRNENSTLEINVSHFGGAALAAVAAPSICLCWLLYCWKITNICSEIGKAGMNGMTSFSSDILLPFPNLNDLNSCGYLALAIYPMHEELWKVQNKKKGRRQIYFTSLTKIIRDLWL